MVSIIILNYNGRRFLEDSISSVLAQSFTEFELIFFDNNSADESVKFVKETFNDPRLKIVESKQNLGFAGGNNKALKHCSNDLIVLLNNDTKTDKDWLKYLVEAVKDGNTVASSFVITMGIPEKYYETNGSVSYLMYNVMNIFPNTEDEFYPNGCSLIFRKSEIGEPFESDYFYYGEDVYMGLKARFMGMKIKFVKDSVVHHFGSGSAPVSAARTFYQERNRMLNLYCFFSAGFILKLLPVIFLVRAARTFSALFSRNHSFWGMVKVPFWFLFNIKSLVSKIRKCRDFKKVHENEIIKYMTSKFLNDETFFARPVNKISYLYSRLAGIKPIEYYQKRNLHI